MLKVLIAEQVPSSNKGEATLMYGICQTIQAYSQDTVQFYLCSSDREADQAAYQDNVEVIDSPGLIPVEYGITKSKKIFMIIWSAFLHMLFLCTHKVVGNLSFKFFKSPLWRKYIECDVILIGHDNSFSKYHLFLIFYGIILQKPIAVYGTTIMPKVLSPGVFRKLGSLLLNKVSLITTRERLTYDFLKSIGVKDVPLFCTADKAFLLDPILLDKGSTLGKKIFTNANEKPIFGVMLVKGSNVFKAAFGDKCHNDEERYRKHIKVLATTLDELCHRLNCCIVFVPHSIGPESEADDRNVHRDVAKKMVNQNCITLLEGDYDAKTLKGVMGEFDFTISERTHGGIASATMHVPTLWISHPGDIRTYGIVGNTLEMRDCLYDITHLDSTTLTQKIIDLWDNREEIVGRLSENTQKAKELAMKNGYYFNRFCKGKKNR
ncbi:polysaccharide pyruvyl transferase family protein [Desulforhopalus sp. 52FAK]